MAQEADKDSPFMTAHTAAAFSLAAGPNVYLVGLNPAVDTLQDYTQRNAATKGNRAVSAGNRGYKVHPSQMESGFTAAIFV